MSIKKRKQSSATTKRNLKWGSKKTKKNIIGGGKFEEKDSLELK
uniref:Uncharacterized protein n=1 Tax=viral metagenome TaxID=1070528 RepID=A0A6C0BTA5_9ZZZZ